MHTSSVTYHRLVFTDVNDYPSLVELVLVLDLEPTDHPDIFDLVQDEGYSLTTHQAISLIGEAYGLDPDSGDTGPDFNRVLKGLRQRRDDIGYTPHTRVFDDSYHNEAIETDIQVNELFDLISVMSDHYFFLDNITTQWSMFSNKNVPGAHTGGNFITTDQFSIAVDRHCDEMETITNKLRSTGAHDKAQYFVEQLLTPQLNETTIKDTEFRWKVLKHLSDYCAAELAVD